MRWNVERREECRPWNCTSATTCTRCEPATRPRPLNYVTGFVYEIRPGR